LQDYDARGAAEVELFRNDKQGLALAARNKRDFLGQKAYVLLTDLAHNMLADFQHKALIGSSYSGYSSKRIIRDLLSIPGYLSFQTEKLEKVNLLSLKQFSEPMRWALLQYISG